MNFKPFHFALLLLLVPHCAHAAFGLRPNGHLDMTALRKAYMESEFEMVRGSLEIFLKRGPKDATRDEMIFTHLYLGVVFAADSNSEAKAESHFNSLLRLSPRIEPVDMFLPKKIQDLFDRIKRDFEKREEYGKRYDAFGNPIPSGRDSALAAPAGKDTTRKAHRVPTVAGKGDHAWVWWTMASAAAVAAGVGAYTLFASEETPAPRRTIADSRNPE